jgi:hypothetical protein
MTTHKNFERFELLSAGKALGNLSADKIVELKSLIARNRHPVNLEFDLLATELEISVSAPTRVPGSLKSRLTTRYPAIQRIRRDQTQHIIRLYQLCLG